MIINKQKHLLIFYIFTLLLIMFYFFSRPDAPIYNPDIEAFRNIAIDLQDDLQLDELPIRSIGYPIILILTDSTKQNSRQLFLVQLVSYALSILMILIVLEELTMPKYYLVLFFIFAWLPPSVAHTLRTLNESITLFCIVTGMSALFRYFQGKSIIWCIISGLLLAYLVLVRATFLLLVPSVIIVILFLHFGLQINVTSKRRLIILLSWLLLTYTIIVGGYILYNTVNFGFSSIEPSTGFHLHTRTVRFIEYLPEEYAIERDILVSSRDAQLVNPKRFELHKGTQYIWTNETIEKLMSATNLSYVNLSNRMLKANIDLIIDNPLEYTRDVVASMATFWYPISWAGGTKLIRQLWIIAHFVIVALYLISSAMLWLGLLLIYLSRNGRSMFLIISRSHGINIFILAIITMIIWQTALVSTMINIGDPRFRIPVELFVYISILFHIRILHGIHHQISIITR